MNQKDQAIASLARDSLLDFSFDDKLAILDPENDIEQNLLEMRRKRAENMAGRQRNYENNLKPGFNDDELNF